VFRVFASTSLLVALAGACNAAYIRLEVVPGCALRQGRVSVDLRIANQGEEPARAVRIEAVLADARAVAGPREALAAGDSFSTSLALGAAPTPAGVYAAVIRVHYTDRKGYPFSSLHSVPFVSAMPEKAREPLVARLAPATIKDRGLLSLAITNRTPRAIETTAEILLPDELGCDKPRRAIVVPADGQITVPFTISNLTALGGSRYAVLARIDYTADGMHMSSVARSPVRIPPPWSPLSTNRARWIVAMLGLAALWATIQFCPRRLSAHRVPAATARWIRRLFPIAFLAGITLVVLIHLCPAGLVTDSLTVGGDMPAHNYLASHLKTQLLQNRRIVSWSQGWWCGFPMFQYYFCLPYLLVVLLDIALPFNVAFKLVSVMGVLLLPTCAWLAGRRLRLPRPIPLLLGAATIPLLFDNAHTMWGVNIYSTLAGMISNSLSFPIMLLFIACAVRDCDDGRFRLGTVLLLVCLLASHFFTSLMALLTLALVPFLAPRAGSRRAFRVLAGECGLATLLMAWWLVPLVAKRAYAVDFGVNWNVDFGKAVPIFAYYAVFPLGLFAILSAVVGPHLRGGPSSGASRRYAPTWAHALGSGNTPRMPVPPERRILTMAWLHLSPKVIRFALITGIMFLAAVFLFHFGYGFWPVFVNVRLWPFMAYAALALAAIGAGILLGPLRAPEPAVAAMCIALLLWASGKPGDAARWAKWNYEGLEKKPHWTVFRDLVLPLKGTPGRLANDLHDYNEALGSSRVFEAVPHLIGKPVLEGGIVNSAAGSMFSYYVQGETSDHCAGFPPIVRPTTFNITNATAHLELFNVKHFIARSARTKRALAASRDWTLLRESRGWQLHELLTHDGSYVSIPDSAPVAVVAADWKRAGLEWMYSFNALSQPFILLRPGQDAPRQCRTAIKHDRFTNYLASFRVRSLRVRTCPGIPYASRPRHLGVRTSSSVLTFQTGKCGGRTASTR